MCKCLIDLHMCILPDCLTMHKQACEISKKTSKNILTIFDLRAIITVTEGNPFNSNRLLGGQKNAYTCSLQKV